MSKLSWYWHRGRAMTPREMALHARKKWRQSVDAHDARDWSGMALPASRAFPILPKPGDAPAEVRAALQQDVEAILAGRWNAFGHLDIQVDDPPKWHCDYLVGRDLATKESAFRLNHRQLPGGADIKLIWELSRWNQLVRLAMAAYVLEHGRAGAKCLEWLEDWVKHNPPYAGWNWTSALEVGLRLIQFSWIDALLTQSPLATVGRWDSRLAALRQAILPPHVWHAWRHQSFGSSANNHLLGELAGLIVATARWPALESCSASLDRLQSQWEREVLAQFAEDGGNKEQALNYHLFSWEFCWQTQAALLAAGRRISPVVDGRLRSVAEFFGTLQVEQDAWDYGDSDNGFVTPFFARDATATTEWWHWLHDTSGGAAIGFWCGKPPSWPGRRKDTGWFRSKYFPETGHQITRSKSWTVRWNLSYLGYLSTAAHGHLDALHVSIWLRGVAMIVDAGTGAYYGNAPLRNWLSSRAAHNGPCPAGIDAPRRLGPFLWSEPQAAPSLVEGLATLHLAGVQIRRSLRSSDDETGWLVEDSCVTGGGAGAAFAVRWQFAPGSRVRRLSELKFTLHRGDVVMEIEVGPQWAMVELSEPVAGEDKIAVVGASPESTEGVVSPAFRSFCRAPFLKLTARASVKPALFSTYFESPLGKLRPDKEDR